MAMSSVLRKASPTVVPLALRAISSPRINLTGSFPSKKEASFLSNQFSSAAAVDNNKEYDKEIVKVLRYQIKLNKFITSLGSGKRWLKNPFYCPTPNDFPFTIEDNLGLGLIDLRMILHGEIIEVVVPLPDHNIKKDVEEIDFNAIITSDEEDEEESIASTRAPTIPMSLNITKANGDRLRITVFASSDEVSIIDMWIINKGESHKGPKFETLPSDLQYCLKEFIKTRGIDKNNVEFIYKYMVSKSKPAQQMLWMEKIENFFS